MPPKFVNCNTVSLHMSAQPVKMTIASRLTMITTLLAEQSKLVMTAPTPVPTPPLLKHISAWERCLHEDDDKDFIRQGIRHGFSFTDPHVVIENLALAQVTDSLSTGSPHIHPIISEAITDELLSGGYVKCSNKPKIISALSTIPKPDGGIFLIHDLSCPSHDENIPVTAGPQLV